jgi:hypothetical protein
MSSPRRVLSFAWHGLLLTCLAQEACSTAEALDPVESEPEVLVLHELARQVTVAQGFELLRLDSAKVEEGVGGSILLNSDLIVNGTFKDQGISSTVEGGLVVGTMHGICTTTGAGVSLTSGGMPGTVAKCEQGLNFYGRGQVVVSGLIEQQDFEHNEPQHLAVLGGTGAFVGVTGELVVTQLVFPGVVKKLELRLERPR